MQAVQPVSISSVGDGTVSGASGIPTSSPMTAASIASCGTISGVMSAPRMSIAEVMLATGRSTGPDPPSASGSAASVIT